MIPWRNLAGGERIFIRGVVAQHDMGPAKDKRGVRESFAKVTFLFAKNGRLRIKEFWSTTIYKYIHIYIYIYIHIYICTLFGVGWHTISIDLNTFDIGLCWKHFASSSEDGIVSRQLVCNCGFRCWACRRFSDVTCLYMFVIVRLHANSVRGPGVTTLG